MTDEVAPTTEEPEVSEAIRATTWNDCPVVELYKQLNILTDRYHAALQAKSPHVAKQLLVGIEALKEIIATRDIEKPRMQTIFF